MRSIAPHPFGQLVTPQQLLTQFSQASHWEERYRLLIQLSRQLPMLSDQDRRNTAELRGCENRVWLGCQKLSNGSLHFYGDSEGRIVKGLLAVLLTLIEGSTAQCIVESDPTEFYRRLGLYQELSASREAGLLTIINHAIEMARKELN